MKKLDRELGLFSVCTIACGAMLSGLFVLPGHAAKIGGSSVHLAFLLAGLLFVPAALSKAEMATALPEAGGDYIFIDRAFGPMVSTITGMGTWLALMLKSAFALVGLSAYLFLVVDLPSSYLIYFACGVGFFLLVINCVGVKKTGQLQSFLVVATFVALAVFVERGSINVHPENFKGMFKSGILGFIQATAFVFVSYAGVTKVASAAEEIKDPSRNIPWGMLLSLSFMILTYVAVVYVFLGVIPIEEMGKDAGIYKNAPISQAAVKFMGQTGEIVISLIAVLALAAMANAGLLASSRYPLALSRYDQLPEAFSKVHPTFSTPMLSVAVTGSAIILSIIFLPVIQLAKLASAFMLLVFALVHLSVIVFRESDIEWYQPEFTSPLYPYTQFLGVLSSVVLIAFMGWLTIIGSVGLIAIGFLWYLVYVRGRAERIGAFFRRPSGSDEAMDRELEIFEQSRTRSRTDLARDSVIVPFFGLSGRDMLKVERRIRLASSLCDYDERLDVVDFVEVPEQSFLSNYDYDSGKFEELEERIELLRNEIDCEIHSDQVITHDSRGALLNYAHEEGPHWVVMDWKEPSRWKNLIGIQKWWLEDLACDALFFKDNGNINFEEIAVVVEPGPYDGEVLYAAEHIAKHFQGNVTFLNAVDSEDDSQREFIESYQTELKEMMGGEPTVEIIPRADWSEMLIERSEDIDLMLIGGRQVETLFDEDELVSTQTRRQLECNYARIRSNLKSPRSILEPEEEEDPDLIRYLRGSGEILRLDVSTKDELFHEIAKTFEKSDKIEESLWEREELQNTYIENGVAFPHAIFQDLETTQFRIVILEEPVPYTETNEEVHLCVVTVGPSQDRENHLRIIRNLSRSLVRHDLRKSLVQVSNFNEAIDVLNRYF